MPETPTPQSITNWDAFAKNALVPLTVDCQDYRPVMLQDRSCHTHVKFNAVDIKRHIDADHGGCFEIYVKRAEGKESPFWKDLRGSRLEAQDLRCGVCDKTIRFHATDIAAHVRPHAGKTKQAYRETVSNRTGCVGMFQIMFGNPGEGADGLEE